MAPLHPDFPVAHVMLHFAMALIVKHPRVQSRHGIDRPIHMLVAGCPLPKQPQKRNSMRGTRETTFLFISGNRTHLVCLELIAS